MALGGRAQKELMRYGQGFASHEFGASYDRFKRDQGDRYNRLMGVSGAGERAYGEMGVGGRRFAAQAGADFVHLSGTGPALYTLVSSEVEGQRIRSKLIQNGHRAFLVKTTEGSPHLTLASDAN